jgi:TorA maturation chaperone TorD
MGNGSFSNEYLKLFLMCKEFHCLPYEGGYLDQPAIYIEAFEHIQGIINQYEANRKGVK